MFEDEIGVEKVDDGKPHYPASRHDTKRRHEQGNVRVFIVVLSKTSMVNCKWHRLHRRSVLRATVRPNYKGKLT